MKSKERMSVAMQKQIADRVPVMCQLSIGHYFLHSGFDSFDVWFRSETFADALISMAKKYNFDGILINLPGRDPFFENYINRIEDKADEKIVYWKNGNYTTIPKDDNPHYYSGAGERPFPTFDEIDPSKLFYVEPWNISEISYPYKWGFDEFRRDETNFFPPYHLDTIKFAMKKAGDTLSIHSEIFSPWSQFMELLNYEQALIAIMDDEGKVKACLERLTEGAISLAKSQAECGVDAILISSAFAGAGLISREQYIQVVLPFEKKIVDSVKKDFSVPIYTHTCGSIGDRLDLMMETGTDGIDTLDPPPLGTVELEEAKKVLEGKAFIKGNIDPVNTLLMGQKQNIISDVKRRIEIGKVGGGYILSTACSVAPATPPEHIELLSQLVEQYGKY